MKHLIPILLLLASYSNKKNNKRIIESDIITKDTTEQFYNTEKLQPKTIQLDSNYCNINILVKTHNNINNLTVEEISTFLSTFHKDCNTNVEFSEWSNELLFKTFEAYTKEVMSLITKENNYEKQAILSVLKSPIHDGIMPQSLIEKIQKLDANNQVTKEIMTALKIAANKY